MKSPGKISVIVVAAALICGAVVFSWHLVKVRITQRKLVQDAKAWRARAESGDAKAQYELARLYYQGKGVPQDHKAAADWYRKSADQGNAKAQYGVGFMYYDGKGVPQDYKAAADWYRKAADQGNPKAQYGLAFMYYEGQGVPQDHAQALDWCRKAAEQGYAEAEYALGYSYYEGKDFPQDHTEAVGWYRKAAEQGYAKAQSDLGYMYYKGEGVPQDYTSAVGWYRKAAEQGFARAQADLGYMYSEGEGCPRDYVESARWYRKAAGQGDQYAQRALDSMNIRLSVVTKVNLSIAFLFSVLLLISSTGKIRNREQRKVTLGGLVLLLWVGLTVYGDFHVGFLQSLSAVNTFHLSRGLLSGIGIAMLVSFVWPEGIKLVLSMCGILFIAFNVYATTHFHLRHFADCPRAFYSINGLLIGMAITTTVLSLESRRAGGSQNGNAAEPATELLQT